MCFYIFRVFILFFFFVKQKTAYEMRISDWSSDVCSSDLTGIEVNLQFPYGTVSGYIEVRKRPTDGLNVMFLVDKGQILCRSYSDGHVSVKFDDQPIKRYACDGDRKSTRLNSSH